MKGYDGVRNAFVRYYDRCGTLTDLSIQVDGFGAFGVGYPINADGYPIMGLFTVYHLPTGYMVSTWACKDPLHALRIAEVLHDKQHHARAWLSHSPSRLRRDGRIKQTISEMRSDVCGLCHDLTESDIYP